MAFSNTKSSSWQSKKKPYPVDSPKFGRPSSREFNYKLTHQKKDGESTHFSGSLSIQNSRKPMHVKYSCIMVENIKDTAKRGRVHDEIRLHDGHMMCHMYSDCIKDMKKVLNNYQGLEETRTDPRIAQFLSGQDSFRNLQAIRQRSMKFSKRNRKNPALEGADTALIDRTSSTSPGRKGAQNRDILRGKTRMMSAWKLKRRTSIQKSSASLSDIASVNTDLEADEEIEPLKPEKIKTSQASSISTHIPVAVEGRVANLPSIGTNAFHHRKNSSSEHNCSSGPAKGNGSFCFDKKVGKQCTTATVEHLLKVNLSKEKTTLNGFYSSGQEEADKNKHRGTGTSHAGENGENKKPARFFKSNRHRRPVLQRIGKIPRHQATDTPSSGAGKTRSLSTGELLTSDEELSKSLMNPDKLTTTTKPNDTQQSSMQFLQNICDRSNLELEKQIRKPSIPYLKIETEQEAMHPGYRSPSPFKADDPDPEFSRDPKHDSLDVMAGSNKIAGITKVSSYVHYKYNIPKNLDQRLELLNIHGYIQDDNA